MQRRAGLAVVLCLVGPSVWAETGKATIQGRIEGSEVTGNAMLTDTPQGLEVVVQVAHVPPGQHGLHIHEFGDCGDGGRSAGGHYNPEGVPHGFLPKDGQVAAHAGDMGNLQVNASGAGMLTVTLPGVSLGSGPRSVGGRAIILHEKPDDFGQPTGNAGGRIGCGAIVITGA